MIKRICLFSIAFGVVSASYASMAGATFQGLGGSSEDLNESYANAVSANGSVVVGQVRGSQGYEAFKWTQRDGLQLLGDFGTVSTMSGALGVSPNGQFVVGFGFQDFTLHAFRWYPGSSMQDLGALPLGGRSVAYDVSADGDSVVGSASVGSGQMAFVWSPGIGMLQLGDLRDGENSEARAITPDGTVIVGSASGTAPYATEAFVWSAADGMIGIGDLPGGGFNSAATAVSADGNWVVGYGTNFGGQVAFRWSEASGMQALGDLPGGLYSSTALGISGDGRIIVGQSEALEGSTAFIWTPDTGMLSLKAYLVALGTPGVADWQLTSANKISQDGKTIIGIGISPDGSYEGYQVQLNVNHAAKINCVANLEDISSEGQGPKSLYAEVRNPDTGERIAIVHGYLNAQNQFFVNIPLPDGVYEISTKPSHWLRQTLRINLHESVANATFTLTNGDVDGDNEVTLSDYADLLRAFATVPTDDLYNRMADLNCDLEVNCADYAVLVRSFGQAGDD